MTEIKHLEGADKEETNTEINAYKNNWTEMKNTQLNR